MACLRENFTGGVLLDGRYESISPLNHGSFGMVFLAQDTLTNSSVAIKCITKGSAANEAGYDFAVDDRSEELTLHRRLGIHDNVVNLLDTFETDAHVYIVLEYCSQGDLYEAIRHGHGPLETEHVRQFMLQLVDAVSYMHSKGVYHRDIKPENIFLTEDGAMKLGDFGLATTDKWSYEMTVGSDRYMAPEQFDSAGAGYSPASADIWAIGICLLNILFSRNPFTTPTESDPLFLDFSRDKQSLFDVFPSMSQDTYEVIVQCMNMDPRKRSLIGARDALNRVVSFTTQDELLDDFCSGEKANIASANREPLRTPSIQNSLAGMDGAFPWAKTLHVTPIKSARQLSAIPDSDTYSEDLFSRSDAATDWSSVKAPASSMSTMYTSHFGASVNSLAINRPSRPSKVSPSAGSVPITMSKPPTLSMSAVFGRRKDQVSKSWSDMWDEDEEEEEREQQRAILAELNSRTWSNESKPEEKKPTDETKAGADDESAVDGLFFQETSPSAHKAMGAPRYSPPSKRHDFEKLDKWAALGERRRGSQNQDALSFSFQSPDAKAQRHFVFDIKSCEAGVWDHINYNNNNNNYNFNNHIKSPQPHLGSKERARECPWNKGRDLNWRSRRHDLGDVEWVGGW